MNAPKFDPTTMKQVIKEALLEAMREERELFLDLLTDALEEVGLVEAIREGQKSEPASRQDVLDALGGHG